MGFVTFYAASLRSAPGFIVVVVICSTSYKDQQLTRSSNSWRCGGKEVTDRSEQDAHVTVPAVTYRLDITYNMEISVCMYVCMHACMIFLCVFIFLLTSWGSVRKLAAGATIPRLSLLSSMRAARVQEDVISCLDPQLRCWIV